MDALPDAEELLADRGYDADRFRDALLAKCIMPCIPPQKTERRLLLTTKICTDSDMRSRSCLARSETGAESPCATTGAPIPFFLPYVSLFPSSFILTNES